MNNKDNKEKNRWVKGGYKPKSVATSVSWVKEQL
jgi:hypothetical protein